MMFEGQEGTVYIRIFVGPASLSSALLLHTTISLQWQIIEPQLCTLVVLPAMIMLLHTYIAPNSIDILLHPFIPGPDTITHHDPQPRPIRMFL
jgi:hypothetical protein